MPDDIKVKRKRSIVITIGAIAGIITIVTGIITIINHFRSQSEHTPSYIQSQSEHTPSLSNQLDNLFGGENWFCYPDDNYTAVGVKRIPRNFKVVSPIKEVHTHQGVFKKEDGGKVPNVPGDCGAHVELERALQKKDIPLWQKDAIDNWQAMSQISGIDITSHWLDDMFGKDNWKVNSKYSFSAQIKEIRNELSIEFPFTSVDANNLKHGVGMRPVRRGFKATVWLAGKIK